MESSKSADDPRPVGSLFLDPASGVFTRDFFLVSPERELVRSARYGEPVTVGLLELVERGVSGAGKPENALKALGDLTRANIHDGNVFALVLMKTSAEVAWIVGERIPREKQAPRLRVGRACSSWMMTPGT